MKDKQKGTSTVAGLLWLALTITCVYGWVMNIVALFKAGGVVTWTAIEIIRIVGIPIPFIGSCMGLFF